MTQISQVTIGPQPYCTTADVNNLIGDVIANSTFAASSVQTFIDEAATYINCQTNNISFGPYRFRERYDGNSKSRLVLAHSPMFWINEINVYFTYPLALSRKAYDWEVLLDRFAGTVDLPSYPASPMFAPYGYTFFPGSKNIEIDAWFGATSQMFGEVLSSTDNTTYSFSNPTAVLQTLDIAYPYLDQTPPKFTPQVYKNGVVLENTTFIINDHHWQIDTDNLYYSLNTGTNGITGITFNEANSSDDVISVDYSFWKIPADIAQATAKRAAANILTAIGTSVFSNNQVDGFDLIMVDGARVQSNSGQWGAIVSRWNADVASIIADNKKLVLDYTGSGYTSGAWFY